jgi:fatty-acyl-CoA synthase
VKANTVNKLQDVSQASVSREETQAHIDKLASGALKHTPEQSYTVADRFEAHAEHAGSQICLIDGELTVSYGELNASANRYAHCARQQGLVAGDVAAVMLENRPAFFYATVGLAKIGVIAALVNTFSRDASLAHALETTGAKLLLLGEECIDNVNTLPATATCPPTLLIPDTGHNTSAQNVIDISNQLAACSSENPPRELRDGVVGSTPLFYVFTSGTTGMPKAAIISHARWMGVGDGWNGLLEVTSQDVFYCILPLFHGAAGMSLVSNAVAAGASIVLRRRFSATKFWHDVRQHNITITQYIGEVCRYLLSQPATDHDQQHSLRCMTGAGLTPDVWRRFIDRFGDISIYEGWGSTESNCNMTNTDGKIGSCGRIPFKDKSNARLVRFDVEADTHPRDENGHFIECDAFETGELIGMVFELPGIAAGRFEGYTNTEATAKKLLHNVFTEGDVWYSSGDLFHRDEEDYFYFEDRLGDTFRWKSENVSTTEVAEALALYRDAEMINVYGVTVPDQEGRAGMAAIEMQPDLDFDPAQLYDIATTKLPPYAVPLFIRVASRSDLTPTFKLKKHQLQREGYDPAAIADPLFVLDHNHQTYSPYNEERLQHLGVAPFKA